MMTEQGAPFYSYTRYFQTYALSQRYRARRLQALATQTKGINRRPSILLVNVKKPVGEASFQTLHRSSRQRGEERTLRYIPAGK